MKNRKAKIQKHQQQVLVPGSGSRCHTRNTSVLQDMAGDRNIPENTKVLFSQISRADVPVTKVARVPPGSRQNLESVWRWQKNKIDGTGVPWARFTEPHRFAGQILAGLISQMLTDLC